MSQARILYLISSISFLGAERVLAELARKLDRDRFQIHIGLMVGHTDMSDAFRNEIGVSDVTFVKFERASRFSFRIVKEIARYIDANEIDIVHSQGYKPDVHVALATLFTRKKCVLISACHTWKLRTLRERLYRWVNLGVLRCFDGIIAISPEVKRELEYAGIRSDRISIIDNGIDVDESQDCSARTYARESLGLSETDFVIGCVASLTVEKAHKDLVRAFHVVSKARSELRLVLVGDGNEQESLVQFACELALTKKVMFAGRRTDVRVLYYAFDIFALVSYAEGLPMAMLEAMAAKIPVVASSVGAIPDVIENGKNGLLVEPGNIENITKAMEYLFENADMRMKLGISGYDTIVDKYSSKRMARDYERFYLDVSSQA